jgi:hypothetical protein
MTEAGSRRQFLTLTTKRAAIRRKTNQRTRRGLFEPLESRQLLASDLPAVTGIGPMNLGMVPVGTSLLSVSFSKLVTGPGGNRLVSRWSGDDVALDATGTNNGILANGAAYAAGRIGKAFSFDGIDDYVQIGAQSSLVFTNAFSVEGWIYPTAFKTSVFFNKEGEYEVGLTSAGTLWYAVANSQPGWNLIDTGYALQLNEWHHIAFTYDAATISIYADGAPIYSLAGSGVIGDVQAASNDFRIGGRQNNANYFAGRIDELTVYGRALSADEVRVISSFQIPGEFRQGQLSFSLVAPGVDKVIGTLDDSSVPLSSVAFTSNVATLRFSPLAESDYQLTVRDSLFDSSGVLLDGNADGLAGGQLLRAFSAVNTPAALPEKPPHVIRSGLDVDGDDVVAPIDALLVINLLNSLPRAGSTALLTTLPTTWGYDTDGDKTVSPIDALTVINHLNGPGRYTVQAPITVLDRTWDPNGGFRRTILVAGGLPISQVFQSNLLVTQTEVIGPQTVQTTWLDGGRATRQTYVDGKQLSDESWSGDDTAVRTTWLNNGTLQRDYFAGSFLVGREEWNNSQFALWDATGVSRRPLQAAASTNDSSFILTKDHVLYTLTAAGRWEQVFSDEVKALVKSSAGNVFVHTADGSVLIWSAIEGWKPSTFVPSPGAAPTPLKALALLQSKEGGVYALQTNNTLLRLSVSSGTWTKDSTDSINRLISSQNGVV